MQDSPELKIGKRAFITTAGITFKSDGFVRHPDPDYPFRQL